MRIEEITKKSLSEVDDRELKSLRWSFTKLWDKHFKDNDKAVVGCFERSDFITKYRMLLKETNSRSLEHSTCDIDRQAFRKAMEVLQVGIDPAQFENISEMTSYILVKEDFAKSAKIEVIIRDNEENQNEALEKELLKTIGEQINKDCIFVYEKDFSGKCIPLFNKMLCPVKKIEKIEIEKEQDILKPDIEKKFERFVPIFPIAKGDEHIVYGVVYEPDVEDSQGDTANTEEIQKAAYQFMEDVQLFKVNHKGKKIKVKVLESYIAPADFVVSNQQIKKGSWILVTRVLDKKVWKDIKEGHLTGYSMAGYAKVS